MESPHTSDSSAERLLTKSNYRSYIGACPYDHMSLWLCALSRLGLACASTVVFMHHGQVPVLFDAAGACDLVDLMVYFIALGVQLVCLLHNS